jgi:hypothetical protein
MILDGPNFSDPGALIAAVKLIYSHFGVLLSLKFCLQHLIRNCVHNFAFVSDATILVFRYFIYKAAEAETTIDFFHQLEEAIIELTLLEMPSYAVGELLLYVLKIPPVMWAQHANIVPTFDHEEYDYYYTQFRRHVYYLTYVLVYNDTGVLKMPEEAGTPSFLEEERKAEEYIKRRMTDKAAYLSYHPGKPCPLFHIKTNNLLEGTNNKFPAAREMVSPRALQEMIRESNKQVSKLLKNLTTAKEEGGKYTTLEAYT